MEISLGRLPWWLRWYKSACNVADPGSVPELRRSPGEGHGNPLVYSCLEKSTDRGAWWATVHGVTKSQTQLRDEHTHTGMINWIIGHWWLNFHLLPLSSFSLFSRSGGGAESSKLVITLWCFWWPDPILKVSGLLHTQQEHTKILASLRRLPNVPGILSQIGKKIKYYVFIKPQVFFLVG